MLKTIAISGMLFASLMSSTAFAKTLDVVASFTVLADVVKQVGGEHVNVASLVGPNGDPHEFEPTPDNAKDLKNAGLVFVSGLGLEGWMDRLITASGYTGNPVVVSDGVDLRQMDEDGKTVTDPHVWNSPKNVKVWVSNIERALIAADPEDAADFTANAAKYQAELDQLSAYAKEKLDAIPEEKRKILTSHDAFGYLGRDFGVTFLSPLGVSTETEASAADVAELIDQIKKEGISVYFFENSNDPRLVQQVATATGAKPGGELYVESLSRDDGPTPTYAKMFTFNIDQIAAAIAK
jgi:zinc/manganese transport system substrate-binding protein